MMTRVEDLRPGDLIDLEGDIYADPTRDEGLPFAYELAMVASVEVETLYCVRVDIEGVDSFGFPTGHLVNVDGRMEGWDDSCGSCGADIGESTSYPWHYGGEDCRAIRGPIDERTE